jgi:hypothetical protein
MFVLVHDPSRIFPVHPTIMAGRNEARFKAISSTPKE